MRIVLDTHVVVSAFLWRGTPYHLLEAIRQSPHAQLFTSTVLLEELAEVLTRPFAAKRLSIVGRTVREVLANYLEAVDVHTAVSAPPPVVADRDDDHVIAAAVAARAELLVSGDRQLLTITQYQGVRIVTPREALREIARS